MRLDYGLVGHGGLELLLRFLKFLAVLSLHVADEVDTL